MPDFSAIRYEEVTKTTDSIVLSKDDVESLYNEAKEYALTIASREVDFNNQSVFRFYWAKDLLINATFQAKVLCTLKGQAKDFDEQREVNLHLENESEFMLDAVKAMMESI